MPLLMSNDDDKRPGMETRFWKGISYALVFLIPLWLLSGSLFPVSGFLAFPESC